MNDFMKIYGKTVWGSKTMIVAVLTLLIAVGQYISQHELMPEHVTTWVLFIVGILGIILRFYTGEPIQAPAFLDKLRDRTLRGWYNNATKYGDQIAKRLLTQEKALASTAKVDSPQQQPQPQSRKQKHKRRK